MERASPELIAALLNADARRLPARVPRSRGAVQAPPRRQRCQCGQCRHCVDNARWERIFTEKFADPNYYTLRLMPTRSPLVSF